MGALRSVAQVISYEISISLILIPIILLSGSFNLNDVIHTQVETIIFLYPLLPLAFIFFVSILAETNRAPFDLPEAEAELVAGYNVEYSGITFAAFFLGEYSNILLMSSLFVVFFMGASENIFFFDIFWTNHQEFNIFSINTLFIPKLYLELIFAIRVICITFLFIFVRANLPRFRFDQLMYIG